MWDEDMGMWDEDMGGQCGGEGAAVAPAVGVPGSCGASSTQQPRFTEHRGRSRESSEEGEARRREWGSEATSWEKTRRRCLASALPRGTQKSHRLSHTRVRARCRAGASSGAVYVIYSKIRRFIIMNNESLHMLTGAAAQT